MLSSLLLALALERTVLIDNTFDVGERAELVQAVEVWNYYLGAGMHLTPRVSELAPSDLRTDAIILMRVDSLCPFIPVMANKVLAWTNYIGGNRVWFVDDRIQTVNLGLVAMHELGHVFGALDRDAPGLMHRYFNADQYKCVDEATALEVGKWLGITLRFCK